MMFSKVYYKLYDPATKTYFENAYPDYVWDVIEKDARGLVEDHPNIEVHQFLGPNMIDNLKQCWRNGK